jgi:hypothetical protein
MPNLVLDTDHRDASWMGLSSFSDLTCLSSQCSALVQKRASAMVYTVTLWRLQFERSRALQNLRSLG